MQPLLDVMVIRQDAVVVGSHLVDTESDYDDDGVA